MWITIADGILYAADSQRGSIVSVNLTDLTVAAFYNVTDDDLQLHAVAVSQQHVYFSAWNRKSDSLNYFNSKRKNYRLEIT